MNLKRLQKVIEKIGKTLPPNDDWLPALIVEKGDGVRIFGFVGSPMGGEWAKDQVAEIIVRCISNSKPDCACFITTAWTLDFEKEGMDEFEVELWKSGAYRISDHPKRVEIVNAYVYGERGPNEGEALMVGYIKRFKTKGPEISRWRVLKDGVTAEGRFPEAVKEGFKQAKGG